MYQPSRIVVLSLLGCALAACGATGNSPANQGSAATPAAATSAATLAAATSAATLPATAMTAVTGAAVPPATATAAIATAAAAAAVGQGDVTETVHVVVVGGPHAGTYDKRPTDGGCSYGLAGAESWGNQYSDANEKTGMSSLQLIVANTKEAAAGTSKFLATFTFGPLVDPSSTSYNVEGRDNNEPKGKGTVKLDDQGKTAVVTIHAVPQPNITIDATITCNTVLRNASAEPAVTSDSSGSDSTDVPSDGSVTATP